MLSQINNKTLSFLKLNSARDLQVSLFSENSARWLVADQSIMTLGAADAV